MPDEVNQLVLSGIIDSRIHTYPNRLIFMVQNGRGRFYVQYSGRNAPVLEHGLRVMIQGALFSVPIHGADAGRIEATQIILLGD